MDTSSSSSQRLPFLDGLRVAAFALLIPYHVGMYYVSWDWHVKSPHAIRALEPFMKLSSPWRLGLLFLVAGAACQGLVARRGAWGAVRERSLRLLVPLVFGMAVVVPPQVYYEVLTKAPHLLPGDGGYLSFWWAYAHGGRYCHAGGCVDAPTLNHLWFLPYVWLYAILGIAVSALPRLTSSPSTLPAWTWLFAPGALLALARVLLFPGHPSTHNLVHDLYNHVQYGCLFAIGWCSRTPWGLGLWMAALRWRWLTLALASVSWAFVEVFSQTPANARLAQDVLLCARLVRGSMTWWAILAACGWAQRLFVAPKPWLRTASAGVFCFYIVHQTLIVVFSQWLAPLHLNAATESIDLVLLTGAGCWVTYLAGRRWRVTSLLLGIPWRGTSRRPALRGADAR